MQPRAVLPSQPQPQRQGLGRWLARLPSQCAVCRSWPSQPVCGPCLSRFALVRPRCPGCALEWLPQPGGPARCPDCLRQPLPLDGCRAALTYGYPWAELLTRMKFQQQTGWVGFFADRLLAEAGVREQLAQLAPGDWLLPMPLSHARLAERGFNQSWELAKALHRLSACHAGLDAQLLLRIRHTTPQSQLPRDQRLANVRGAFLVDPLQRPAVAGRSVLLVDDVMTSGASLSEASLALKAAGARSVSALVVARTPP